MSFKLPSETIFYVIESTIKAYRKYALQNILAEVDDMTIDQGMLLLFLNEYPELSQKEIAQLIFKDNASMTRMINTMVKKNYLKRSLHTGDRRRFQLEITEKGKTVLEKLPPIIDHNRTSSLQGISKNELEQLELILNKIKANCSSS